MAFATGYLRTGLKETDAGGVFEVIAEILAIPAFDSPHLADDEPPNVALAR